MKLHSSATSPFVRKVLVVAQELGIENSFDSDLVMVSPIEANPSVHDQNPLGKIPVLELDDGLPLFDSRVICEYLDSRSDDGSVFPQAGPARWLALQQQATADGMMDAGIMARYETFMRPEQYRWQQWVDGQQSKFKRSVDALEREADSLQGRVDIGTIAVACALGYLDFRFGSENWRQGRPKLTAWFDDFNQRPSMQATIPADG